MKQIQPFQKHWLQFTSIVVCRLNNKYMKDRKSTWYGMVFYMVVIMKYLGLHKCFCIRLWQFPVSIDNSDIYIWHPILIGGVFCEFKIYQLLHCISSSAVIRRILTHLFCKNSQEIWCHTVIRDTDMPIKWEIYYHPNYTRFICFYKMIILDERYVFYCHYIVIHFGT